MDCKPIPGVAKFLQLIAILSLPIIAASQYGQTYYVTPNVSSCTNVNVTCQEFKRYFNNASYYFQSETQFIFLPGKHLFDLGSMLSIQDKVNIRLVGSDNFTQRSVADDVKEYEFDIYAYDTNISYLQSSTIILCTNPSGLSFENVNNLTLANFSMLNCGQTPSAYGVKYGIYLYNVNNLLIDGLTVRNSTGYGLYGSNVLGQSQIMRSSFVGNNQYVKYFSERVPITNCMNEVGSYYSLVQYSEGGNVAFIYSNSEYSQFQLSISVVLVALSVSGGDGVLGAGLIFQSDQTISDLNLNVTNFITYRNYGLVDGVNLYIEISSPSSKVTFSNMLSAYSISSKSGAIYRNAATADSLLTIQHSAFECNFSNNDGSSLYIINENDYAQATMLLYNTKFTQDLSTSSLYMNNIKSIQFVDLSCNGCNIIWFNSETVFSGCNSFVQSKLIFMPGSLITLEGSNTFINSNINTQGSTVILHGNNTFSRNYNITSSGGAISLQRSSLYIDYITTFIDNTAKYGGAIYVDSTSNISFNSPTNVLFINNTAVLTGGAIYVEPLASIACFYGCNTNNINLYFEGNYAGDAGSVLYGGNIDICQIEGCPFNSTYVFNTITKIGYHDPSSSLISSDSP